jgi:hypothetical protein
MCLVLDRYLADEGYRSQSNEPLKEMITFFNLCAGETVPPGKFDPEVVNRNLPEAIFWRLRSTGHQLPPMSPQDYAKAAALIVKWLIKDPYEVAQSQKLSLHKFFETVEDEMDSQKGGVVI